MLYEEKGDALSGYVLRYGEDRKEWGPNYEIKIKLAEERNIQE